MLRQSQLVIADSGGIQEETTYSEFSITARTITEKPITVEIRTKHLVCDSYQNAEEKH
jgi:UDP-N-acetylglucosamine 2-epimerase